MPTTFKAIVNMAHKRRDGTYNVKIRVTHNSKVMKVATNVYLIDLQLTKKGRIKDQRIVDQLDDIIRRWRNISNQLGVSAEALDVADVVRYIRTTEDNTHEYIDFIKFSEKCITKMRSGTAKSYEATLKALKRFTKQEELDIKKINVAFLEAFESFLNDEPVLVQRRNKGLVPINKSKAGGRAISKYMACIRHLHNLAKDTYNDEDCGVILIPQSPFKKYKIKTTSAPKKKAVDRSVIQSIINLPDVTQRLGPVNKFPRRDLARDCFLLSFGLAGMNAADLFGDNATRKGDVIIYNRQKTASRRYDEAEMHIKIEPCIAKLVEKYKDPTGKRLFCFYHHYKDTSFFNAALNQGLTHIDKILEHNEAIAELLPKHIIFYAARHSWATIARSSILNIDKYTVHEGLNHVDDTMKVTDRYIDKDWTNIWNANAQVLSLFDWNAVM